MTLGDLRFVVLTRTDGKSAAVRVGAIELIERAPEGSGHNGTMLQIGGVERFFTELPDDVVSKIEDVLE